METKQRPLYEGWENRPFLSPKIIAEILTCCPREAQEIVYRAGGAKLGGLLRVETAKFKAWMATERARSLEERRGSQLVAARRQYLATHTRPYTHHKKPQE